MDKKVVKLDLALMLNGALMGAFVGILTWMFLGVVNVRTHFKRFFQYKILDFNSCKYRWYISRNNAKTFWRIPKIYGPNFRRI
ncbi:hypothetical protein [Terrisporobacter petrolearius]|uniref:hypothetical protein n=1 Tax=Terrisporobacter petrolearius TaxID=1460447 RepID=UPI0031CC6589